MAYWVTGSVAPFDDALTPPAKVTGSAPDTDTTEIDVWRQGVEITRPNYMYVGTQPKIWAGSMDKWGRITHQVETYQSYGQAVSFTEFYGSAAFTDLPAFNPVAYITLGNAYPRPVYFNDGPQQAQEAIIEPLPIPFRLDTNEAQPYMRRTAGEVEDGNNFDDVYHSTNRIEQFIEYDVPLTIRYFLDEGEMWFGDTFDGAVKTSNWLPAVRRVRAPYTDQNHEYITSQLHADTTFQAAISNMHYDLDDDLRPLGTRSACAGQSHYGPNATIYGTDSIAFVNRMRGS